MLVIHNTLNRTKEPFTTIEEAKVKMYCCGITTYDYCHLGHARTCIIWDTVRNYLQWIGYEVKYVQNFTDIDDKILNRATKEKTTMKKVSDTFINAYFEDMERLHVEKADAYPRVTHIVEDIQNLIKELEKNGYAYTSEGDVYFNIQSFKEYGKLSGRKLEDLKTGASGRVSLEDIQSGKKRDSADFALWKKAKSTETSWDSPWGKGRPGWHIECSAMIKKELGETIDLHVGGSDLVFPHHENEIAQSEAVTGKELSRYWSHNGMVKVDGEKMSKSLGNFITIRELLDRFEPMAIRLFVLQTHYRKPLDFSNKSLVAATSSWQTLSDGLLFGHQYGEKLGFKNNSSVELLPDLTQRFQKAVDDDFNFAGGLVVLFEIAKSLRKESNLLIHTGNTTSSPKLLEEQWYTLKHLAGILRLETDQNIADTSLSRKLTDEEINELIEKRKIAKNAKRYAESDLIRDHLKKHNIVLLDMSDGSTTWHSN
ncbi:MAG: cysteine--tRNA ligase [Candidatus Atelocyanobacterium thalassa]|uniref:Cysteine--tRNA ligase n=1 Tax=Candidatus Atelocyanobacterium thalassa isolate SIO64986 TaxID=1527444 RepID=A0A086CI71_9CHRO|nr:MAG: cysteinyl-tRNA synthetase [Candidatus Atelocyanobacterium thalassa isolate SIO64986]